MVGKEERVAALSLRRAGLEVGATVHMPYGGAAEGTVLAQDPPAHAQGIARPSINLLVAALGEDAPDGYVMPDLVGTLAAGAQAQLARVGIKSTTSFVDVAVPAVGSGNAQPRLPVKPGAVLSQSPMAGSRVDQGALVKFTVAK
jgi:beta-lactam-binding protein with PASTA domain